MARSEQPRTNRTPGQAIAWAIKVISILLAALVLCLFLIGALGTDTNYFRVMTVLSSSMEPTLPRGALIISLPEQLSSVQVGDIITFYPPDQQTLETHRILRVLKPGAQPVVQTKGDANAAPDPWKLQLLTTPVWKTHVAIPRVGYVIQWLRQPIVLWLAILVLAGILVYDILNKKDGL